MTGLPCSTGPLLRQFYAIGAGLLLWVMGGMQQTLLAQTTVTVSPDSTEQHQHAYTKGWQNPELFFSPHIGRLVRHSSKLTIRTGQRVWSQELGVQWTLRGVADWHRAYRYPKVGVSVFYAEPGEGAHGHIVSLMPTVSFTLLRTHRLLLSFRVGTGVAWVSRPYDSFTNAAENALGSHWNGNAHFSTQITARISPRWSMLLGAGLHHYSNGGYELPNFGINIFGGQGALLYHLDPRTHLPPQLGARRPFRRSWGFNISGGLGLGEYIALNGPKYPVWSLSTAATWRFRAWQRLAVGLEAERNRGVYEWGLSNATFANPTAALWGSTRLGVLVGDEFLIGPVSIYLQTALHVGPAPINQLILSRNYNVLMVRYYLPSRWKNRVYVGVSLKAYKAVAERISWSVGFDWR
jgi:Lipid A 3-O-deacylase (PagL)